MSLPLKKLYLILVALGLYSECSLSLVVVSRGLALVSMCGPVIAEASFVAEHGLSSHGAQAELPRGR